MKTERVPSRPFIHWLFILIISSAASLLQAQEVQSFLVATEPSGALFNVDGQVYSRPMTFLWPRGSKHVVTVFTGTLTNPTFGPVCGATGPTAYQYDTSCNWRYAFSGWTNDKGGFAGSDNLTQAITVDGTTTSMTAKFTLEHRIQVITYDGNGSGPTGDCQAKANKPFGMPKAGESIGIAFVGSTCFDYSGFTYLAEGTYQLNAVPLYGYAFAGWSINGAQFGTVATFKVTGTATIMGRFVQAKRVRFYTDPPELKVRVDRTDVLTPDPQHYIDYYPVPGLYDFLPGSQHVIGAPSPQLERFSGFNYVFKEWSNGTKQDGAFTADYEVGKIEVLTAKFVRGVSVNFSTEPKGLRLNIDGRENWPFYTFVWGLGSEYAVTAPAEQTDIAGRRWKFAGWDNGGPASQQVVIDQAAIDKGGLYYKAKYEALPRIELQSSISGIRFDVDGTPCATPCRLDKPAGTVVKISAPKTIPIDEGSRLEFVGWSDGGSADRVVTVSGDLSIQARYQRSNRLTVLMNPANSANITLAPSSADGFYPADQTVSVVLESRPGYKFRRWEGDLAGTAAKGILNMSGARTIQAMLDKTPWLQPASVGSAVGPIPTEGVAAGSLILISGASLANSEETSTRYPLPQTLAGVVVVVGDRILQLTSVTPEAITALLPSDLAPGTYQLTYRAASGQELTTEFRIVKNAPGIFPSAFHEDGSTITADSPAQPGETIALSGTGFGPLTLPFVDGFATPANPPNALSDSVTVMLGDRAIPADWAGATAGASGLITTRFRIPDDATGVTDVRVQVNENPSNTIPVPIR